MGVGGVCCISYVVMCCSVLCCSVLCCIVLCCAIMLRFPFLGPSRVGSGLVRVTEGERGGDPLGNCVSCFTGLDWIFHDHPPLFFILFILYTIYSISRARGTDGT